MRNILTINIIYYYFARSPVSALTIKYLVVIPKIRSATTIDSKMFGFKLKSSSWM